MKAYGVKIKDISRDCTGTSKYGTSKLLERCSCGKTRCNMTKTKSKSRKAKERNFKIVI